MKSYNFTGIYFCGQNVLNLLARVEIRNKSHESQHLGTRSKQAPTHNLYVNIKLADQVARLVSWSSSEKEWSRGLSLLTHGSQIWFPRSTSHSDETLNRGQRLRITFLCWWDVKPSSLTQVGEKIKIDPQK